MWDAFKDFIFWCISSFHGFFHDWGMAIIVVTLIFRALVYPLMQKQIKSSYQMQKVQPKLKEIQQKYANDQPRMQEEMQKLYAEAKFNPIAGCLPIFLQMPIFVALFQVLQEMSTRTQGSTYQFYHLVPDLTLSPASSLEQGIVTFIPYVVLLVIFAGATFAPMVFQMQIQTDDAQKKQTLILAGFMSLFMLFIGWSSPGGVLLFWGASSLFGVAQQQITMRVLRQKDAHSEAEIIDSKPIEVDVTRKIKKKRPTKNH